MEMAFSSDSTKLALWVMEGSTNSEAGTGRLVVVDLKTSEATVLKEIDARECAVSPPCFVPGDRMLCYLRFPIPNEKAMKAQNTDRAKRVLQIDDWLTRSREKWGIPQPVSAEECMTAPVLGGRLDSIPSFKVSNRMSIALLGGEPYPGDLIVVDAATGKVVHQIRLQFPLVNLLKPPSTPLATIIRKVAVGMRPQCDPARGKIYVCDGNVAMAIDLKKEESTIVAIPATGMAAAPGGGKLAFICGDAIGIRDFAKDTMLFKRVRVFPHTWELEWAGDGSVVLAGGESKGETIAWELVWIGLDGRVLRTIRTKQPADGAPLPSHVAVSPTGKRLVLTTAKHTSLLDDSGKVLASWAQPGEAIAAPIFSPDGRLLAMKCQKSSDKKIASGQYLLLFDPDGKLKRAYKKPASWPKPVPGKPPKPLKLGAQGRLRFQLEALYRRPSW